jgi:hypothetical protein
MAAVAFVFLAVWGFAHLCNRDAHKAFRSVLDLLDKEQAAIDARSNRPEARRRRKKRVLGFSIGDFFGSVHERPASDE